MKHIIMTVQDIADMVEKYEPETIFKCLETGEEMNLANCYFYYDGQEITLEPTV